MLMGAPPPSCTALASAGAMFCPGRAPKSLRSTAGAAVGRLAATNPAPPMIPRRDNNGGNMSSPVEVPEGYSLSTTFDEDEHSVKSVSFAKSKAWQGYDRGRHSS